MYALARALTRACIILFYMRIFTTPEARPRIIATLVISIAISITFTIGVAFQCTPVSYFWTRWDGEHLGGCINSFDFTWAGWMIGIAYDFWIIYVPMPLVARLNLSIKKKILVLIMFATGLV